MDFVRLYAETVSYFFAISVLLLPIYVFPAGSPQLFHFAYAFTVLSSVLLILDRRSIDTLIGNKVLLALFCFSFYALLLTIFYAVHHENFKILKYPILYLLNALICLIAIRLLSSNIRRNILGALLISIVSLFVFLVIYENVQLYKSKRLLLTFNNPNQLGYFALLVLSFFVLAYRVSQVKLPMLLFVYLIAGTLIFLSMSKSAILSLLVFTLLFPLYAERKQKLRAASIIAITLVCTLAASVLLKSKITESVAKTENAGSTLGTFQSASSMFSNLSAGKDNNLSARGYDRFIEHSHYLIFGAGEGLNYRFKTNKELHSTLGIIVFGYGMPATCMLILMMMYLIRSMKWDAVLVLGPTLIYGLTHNGFRSPLLWLLIVFAFIEYENRAYQYKNTPLLFDRFSFSNFSSFLHKIKNRTYKQFGI